MDARRDAECADGARAPLTIVVELAGRECTVVLAGELDLSTAPRLSAAVDQLVAEGAVDVVMVDGAGLSFVDSAGLHAFLAARMAAQENGLSFSVCRPSSALQRLLELSGLDDLLDHDHPAP